MELESTMSIFNYRTGEWENVTYDPFEGDSHTDYIPQVDAAQRIYQLYLKMGYSRQRAAFKVLTACIEDDEE